MLRLCGVVLATVVLNACGAIPVSTDFDPEWHMPATPVYAWMARPHGKLDPMVDNDLVETRIHRAVDEQLAAKGLIQGASEAQANVLVTYHIGEEEKLDINTFHSNSLWLLPMLALLGWRIRFGCMGDAIHAGQLGD